MTAIEVFKRYSDYFIQNDLVTGIFRSIGWGLAKCFAFICSAAESAVDKIMSMGGLLQAESIKTFYSEYRGIIWTILVGGIMFVGILMLLNKLKNRMDVFINLILSIIIIVALPTMMVEVNNIMQSAYRYLNPTTSSSADTIIKSNITDVYLLYNNGFTATPNPNNNISENNIRQIDINEIITADDVEGDLAKEVFKNRIITNSDGQESLEELNDSWIDFFDENYYRFKVDFASIILTLIITTIVFIFSGIKIARIFYELIVHEFIATVVAFADIHSGQRLKAIIQSICTAFLTLFFVALLLKLYILTAAWTATKLSGFAYIFATAGLALAVIDGPNMIERVFGVDAGIKHGFGAWYATRATARGAIKIAKTTKRAVGNVAGKISNAVNHHRSASHHSENGSVNENSPVNNHNDQSQNINANNQNNANVNAPQSTQQNTQQQTASHSSMNQNNRSESPINNRPADQASPPTAGSPAGDNRTSRPDATNKSVSPINGAAQQRKRPDAPSGSSNVRHKNTSNTSQPRPTDPRSSAANPAANRPIRTYQLTTDNRIVPNAPTRNISTPTPPQQGGKPNGISDTKIDKKRT